MRKKSTRMLKREALLNTTWFCEGCWCETDGGELVVADGDFRAPEADFSENLGRAVSNLLDDPSLSEEEKVWRRERFWRATRVNAMAYPTISELPASVTEVD